MRRGLIAAAGVVLAALILAQIVLPGVASDRLTSDLQRHGAGVHVDVSAFPAVKLLWHQADDVKVRMDSYKTGASGSGTSLADLLARTKDTGSLDVDVGVVDDNLLRMHAVHLVKKGNRLTGQVELRKSDIDAALPTGLRVSGQDVGQNTLVVAGQTDVFGQHISARARILVDGGRIVIRPDGSLLASLVSVPVFSDRRIAVDALGAEPTADGFAVTSSGLLKG